MLAEGGTNLVIDCLFSLSRVLVRLCVSVVSVVKLAVVLCIGVSQILLRTSDLLDARIGLKLAYQQDQQIAPANSAISATPAC